MKIDLSYNEIKNIRYIINNHPNKKSTIIEILNFIQKNRKWISDKSIYAISKILRIPSVDIERISTFYNNIFRKPVGINVIKYCDSSICYINGASNIKKTIECDLLIKTGETTQNKKFTLIPTGCLGHCNKSPVIMINDKIYTSINKKEIKNILKNIDEKQK